MPTLQEFHKTALTAIVSSVTNITSTGHEDAPHTDSVSCLQLLGLPSYGNCRGRLNFQYHLGSPCLPSNGGQDGRYQGVKLQASLRVG